MEGKYQIDAYALTPKNQKPIEEVSIFSSGPGSGAEPRFGRIKMKLEET
jgi:hypothetical protein